MGCPDQPSQTDLDRNVDPDAEKQHAMLQAFLATLTHYFGSVSGLFRPVVDPRNPKQITYPLASLLFTGVLMFLCRLGARRQITHQLRENQASASKFGALFGVEQVPHGDTLSHTFEQLTPDQVQEILPNMVETLIRNKVLYPFRLLDHYVMIAMDGTGMLTFQQRHCPHCLTRTLRDGRTLYYHHVLEAKLVTANGFAFSVMTEFIENSDPQAAKQDCELKAFYRLVERLKARFPRLPICLLLDGLFAGGPTFARCQAYGWKYLIVLRDDDLPSVNQEFEALCDLEPTQCMEHTLDPDESIHQVYRWINAIDYQDATGRDHLVSVLECVETKPKGLTQQTVTKFKWVTNFHLTAKRSPILANEGGRLRWKIENEGFNIQKNGGFALEHAYSQDETAGKIFYFLLQIAYVIFQLVEKGSLFRKAFPKGVGSLHNIARALLEAWRNLRLPKPALIRLCTGSFQIRFDSS
jgi:hypothetical protein